MSENIEIEPDAEEFILNVSSNTVKILLNYMEKFIQNYNDVKNANEKLRGLVSQALNTGDVNVNTGDMETGDMDRGDVERGDVERGDVIVDTSDVDTSDVIVDTDDVIVDTREPERMGGGSRKKRRRRRNKSNKK